MSAWLDRNPWTVWCWGVGLVVGNIVWAAVTGDALGFWRTFWVSILVYVPCRTADHYRSQAKKSDETIANIRRICDDIAKGLRR